MPLFDAYIVIAGTLITLYFTRLIRQKNAQKVFAKYHECEPLVKAYNKLPFGLDRKWQILTHRGSILDDILTSRFVQVGRYIYTDNQWGNPPIICAEPEVIKAVLSSKFRDWDIDSNRYPALGPWLGRGVLVSSHQSKPSLWAVARSLLRPRFASAAAYDHSLIENCVEDFLLALNKIKTEIATEDLLPLIRRLNIDIVTNVFCDASGVSQQQPTAEPSKCHDVLRKETLEGAFDDIGPVAGLRLQTGKLYWLFTSKPFRDGCNTFSRLADAWISQALASIESSPHGKLAEAGDQLESKNQFTEELVSSSDDRELLRDLLVQLLFAGIDTSTSMLSFAILELARNSGSWNWLRDELSSHGLLTAPPEAVTASRLKECQFLQNIIKETLRLYPPVPINSREAVRDTVLPAGGGADGVKPVFVPKGTSLKYSVYVM